MTVARALGLALSAASAAVIVVFGGMLGGALLIVVLAAGSVVLVVSLLKPRPVPPWWLHPAAMLGIGGAVALIASALPSETTYVLQWSAPKLLRPDDYLLLASYVAAATMAAFITAGATRPITAPALHEDHIRRLATSGRLLLVLSFVGYAVWVAFAVARGLRPADIQALLAGQPRASDVLKLYYFATVPGITTFTQFAPTGIAAVALARCLGDQRPIAWWIGPSLVLAVVRVYVNSERLAILEAVTPLLFTLVAYWLARGRPIGELRRGVVAIAPLALPLGLVLLFGVFEYSRSWTFYSQNSDMTYPEFVLNRIAAYYATATNNSIVLMSTESPGVPYFVVQWMWDMPVIGALLSDLVLRGETPVSAYMVALETYANLEFNNPGGWLVAAFDFGASGGLLWWALIGAAFGALYRGVFSGSLTCWLLYAISVIGFLDTPRIFFWGSGRFFPAVVAVFLCVAYVRGQRGEVLLARVARRRRKPPSRGRG